MNHMATVLHGVHIQFPTRYAGIDVPTHRPATDLVHRQALVPAHHPATDPAAHHPALSRAHHPALVPAHRPVGRSQRSRAATNDGALPNPYRRTGPPRLVVRRRPTAVSPAPGHRKSPGDPAR
ncbi:hypothetical protein [Nocardia sp. CNY236]|uniref:hypothetical protein n=1 Tax=Nocardia sp. CNY236 TaxID=1169152 RepID=UPI00056B1479|nr:hypothetical protein [Nocardia sp. CNY236]